MDELLAEFLAETREMLEAVGGKLVAWEANPDDRAGLDAIFRFVHTVKGNCGFFDYPRLELLSHAAEDALAEVRAGRRPMTPQLVSAVLAVVDRIGEMIDAIEAGDDLPERGDEALIAALASDEGGDGAGQEPAGGGAAPRTPSGGGAQRSVRLPVRLLDSVMSSVSDLVLARNDLARRLRESGADPAIGGPFDRLSTILDGVRDSVTRMRMQRVEHLFGALPRLVRDLSAELGKQATVDFEGGDVELDREMIEMIRDPLTHLVRNAIDHGIEPPQARIAAGKRPIGKLHLSARQSGNQIMLALSDDGRGIDGQALVARAIAAGAITREEAGALDSKQRDALIFEPGISTAEAVTAVSGRGVGMDVVRANIERVGGAIEVASTFGEGTRILLSLPLTLSIVPALTVSAGGQMFAIPRAVVEEIVHAASSDATFARMGDALLVTVRGRRIPCLSLAQMLELAEGVAMENAALVLIRLAGGGMFALAADRVHDHEELVIKPLAPAVMTVGLYAGTTLLDDGSPVLMLDVAGIARDAKLGGDMRARDHGEERDAPDIAQPKVPVILFVGLDGRRRAIRMETVTRIEIVPAAAVDLGGERPQVVIEGAIIALAGTGRGACSGDHLSVLRLSDGAVELAYAAAQIIDTALMDGALVRSGSHGEIEGTILIGGEAAEVVDTFELFAAHARPRRDPEPLVCRLPTGDAWARAILGPLVESAGYRVVGGEWEGDADIAILFADPSEPDPPAGQVIRLHMDPAAAVDRGGLYRYDRAGIMAALASARSRATA